MPDLDVCYFCSERIVRECETYQAVSDILREGPRAFPTHPICDKCLDKKVYLRRDQCQLCGALRPLLAVANNSMTSSAYWAIFSTERFCTKKKELSLCAKCAKAPISSFLLDGDNLIEPKFERYVYLDADDLEVLKRCWQLPNWKNMTKMPILHRRMHDF